jgi:hypothetical protein
MTCLFISLTLSSLNDWVEVSEFEILVQKELAKFNQSSIFHDGITCQLN